MMPRSGIRARILSVVLVAFGGVGSVQAQSVPSVMAWQEEIRGSREHHLRWPVAVASATVEEIAVADAFGSRLILFRKEGLGDWEVSTVVELPGTPQDVDYGNGRYFVSLRDGAGVVTAEGPQLRLRQQALPAGVVPGALAAHPAGGFMVWDAAGGRVLSFDEQGELRLEVVVDEYVTALAAAADGGFFIAGTHPAEVRRYTAAGELRDRWPIPGAFPVPAWPAGLAVGPSGSLVVADRHNGRLLVLNGSGGLTGQGARRGWESGLLRFPRGITRLTDGRIVVADQGNARIQIFRSSEEDSGQ